MSFAEADRSTELLTGDVPDRILNRVAVNAAVQACGLSSVAALDTLVHQNHQKSALRSARTHPDDFWTRVARGMPRLRLDGRDGATQVKLTRALPFLGAGQQTLERVRRWPLWALIHPDPITPDDLFALEEVIANLATTPEWFQLTDRSVSPAEQGEYIVELLRCDQVELALNGLWHSLRRSSIEADLSRYIRLYQVWLVLRPQLEAHALFQRAVPMLYQFTAYWFGQVEILTDRFIRPGSEAHYTEFVRATWRSLNRRFSDDALHCLWEPFRYHGSPPEPSMEVRPKNDLTTQYFDRDELPDYEVTDRWEAWPLIAVLYGEQRVARHLRPGLRSRPAKWRARYATTRPIPIDFDGPVTAAMLAKLLDCTESEIQERERARQLFTVPTKRGPEFPAFQALPGVEGEPLAQVLRELGSPTMDGAAVGAFFNTRAELLTQLTPIEVLIGGPPTRPVESASRALMFAHDELRLSAVLAASAAYRKKLTRKPRPLAPTKPRPTSKPGKRIEPAATAKPPSTSTA